MNNLTELAELLMYLTPIVIPVLVFLCFERDWRNMDKIEIAFWIIMTIGLILLLEYFCCVIITSNYELDILLSRR